jgi:hypothetical protein
MQDIFDLDINTTSNVLGEQNGAIAKPNPIEKQKPNKSSIFGMAKGLVSVVVLFLILSSR